MKLKVLPVSVIAIVMIIGFSIGGKAWMNNKVKKEEEEIIEVEKMAAKALKNTFANIKEIDFVKTDYHDMTGSYFINITMISDSGDKNSFTFAYEIKEPDKIGSYIVEDTSVQEKGVTTSTVSVTYSNNEKDEI